ncbi:MAG: 4a-hydroxytetrahydrobiopterin dehydratase [Bacteroidetes bacterium GWF2_49_14]|nr:MAG: 4a-hydroxytetrahydrobiopterin dehydratase [Bacteroidetes bacterium GWF2_49_14]HBB91410.1 4a-hydroxytetrahydrobiopterin dehydratase [Bacteroidales bacterium]
MELVEKKCKPCEAGTPPLTEKEITELKKQVHPGWQVSENMKITNSYSFVNYSHTMDFVNKVADLAESEGHHPDMHVYYGKVVIDLWTHSVKGLSENDFILAAKIDRI